MMQLASNIADQDMSIFDATPQHTTFGIANAKIVAPGDPARSLLVHRPVIRGPGQMPPLGTMTPDGEGSTLLAQWIASLSSQPPAAKPVQP